MYIENIERDEKWWEIMDLMDWCQGGCDVGMEMGDWFRFRRGIREEIRRHLKEKREKRENKGE